MDKQKYLPRIYFCLHSSSQGANGIYCLDLEIFAAVYLFNSYLEDNEIAFLKYIGTISSY